jgi:hypothetical protein
VSAPAHRPPPADAAVIEVFELSFLKRWSMRRIVEHSESQPWGPISIGTVKAWVDKGHGWWIQFERQTQVAATDLQRMWVGKFLEMLSDDIDDGRVNTAEAIAIGMPVLERHARLEGTDAAKRLRIENDTGAPARLTPSQQAQITALRERVQREEIENRGRPDDTP